MNPVKAPSMPGNPDEKWEETSSSEYPRIFRFDEEGSPEPPVWPEDEEEEEEELDRFPLVVLNDQRHVPHRL